MDKQTKKYALIGGGLLLAIAFLQGGVEAPENIVNDLAIAPQNGTYPTRDLSQIDTIVVHHAAVDSSLPGANPYGYARFHTTNDNYLLPGIAYHVVVQPDGKTYLTNKLSTVSAHVGTMNPRSVGIIVSGNFDNEPFTATQEKGLVDAIKWVQKKIGRKLNLKGHYEYSTKTCPGMNIRARLDDIARKTGAIRA